MLRWAKRDQYLIAAAGALMLLGIPVVYDQITYAQTEKKLNTIAGELWRQQSSPSVVRIGDTTKAALRFAATAGPNASWEVRRGDGPSPIGNRQADAHILYSYKGTPVLGLRMRQDGDRFHILGHWSP